MKHTQPGPALPLSDALLRLADQPHLAVLHAGGLGWSYATWGSAPQAIADHHALARWVGAGAGVASTEDAPDEAWAAGFPGGAFVQLDYEFPAVPGWAWPAPAFAAWDPQGRCTLHAADEAGFAHLRAGLARAPTPLALPRLATPLLPAWETAGHRERVARIRTYIAAGDIYQANLTVPFRATLQAGAHRDLALFLALAAASPAPFAAFFRGAAGRSVVSHSPECFLAARGGALASAPIKGTRRRVAGAETATRAALLGADKDRAELAMIVDLVRNDLGRVALPGSVRVATAARVLDLPYVHHLVARIAARLAPGRGAADAIAAAFPAGSITGAPKLRAMQIIAELEAGPRGPYCGAFGWLGGGDAALAVAIRTLVIDGDAVRLDAGGGIVADSAADAEWDEVHAKAAAMAAALGSAL